MASALRLRHLLALLLVCAGPSLPAAETEIWLEEFSFLPPPEWSVSREGRIIEMTGPDGTQRIIAMLAPTTVPLPGEPAPDEPAELGELPVSWRQVRAGGFEQLHVIVELPRPDDRQLRILFQTSEPPLADVRPLFDVFLLGLQRWQRPPAGWAHLPEAMVLPSVDPLADLAPADFDGVGP